MGELVSDTVESLRGVFGDEGVSLLPGGLPVVAGEYVEPLQRKECCLIEYLAPELAGSPEGASTVLEWARREFPDARKIIVRLPGLADRLPGFENYLYYMFLENPPGATADSAGIEVRRAASADLPRVASWLVMAFDDALEMQAEEAAPGAASAQADAVLAGAGTVSFIAAHEGHDLGHVTLLRGQRDDLTGVVYNELLDVFVDRDHPRRHGAEAALVHAAWEFSVAEARPVLGHIVHRHETCHSAGYEEVLLQRLAARGWRFAHKYQHVDVAD